MDSYSIEIRPPFSPPSEDARLVIFTDGYIHEEMPDVREHLVACSKYSSTHRVYLVSGLFVLDDRLYLCLFGRDGLPIFRQPALYLPATVRGRLISGDRVEVVHTELGNICLCVDEDVLHPQVFRAAALKGADLAICIQRADDPVEDSPERLMCTAWNAAQSNNIYVINHSASGSAVCCPAPLTRAGDGYLVRRTPDPTPTRDQTEQMVRFGLNMPRLDEIRNRFELMENINTQLVVRYSDELGR